MKSLGNETGQTVIVAVAGFAVLFGFAAFATDVGVQLHEKRLAQTAADAAAIAGASALYAGGNEDAATTAGRADAELNGFSNGSDGTVVTINTPVTDDSNPAFNVSGTVEAIVSRPVATPFMNVFMHLFNPGSAFTGLTVGARSVARLGPGNACIYTLGATGIDIDGSGGETLIDKGCGIIDDSSSSDALTLSGGAQVNVTTIGIVGGLSDSGNSSTDASIVYTGIAYVSDPLGYLDPEAPSYNTASLSCAPDPNVSATSTLTPSGPVACYNGLTVSGGATLNITNPGVIVVNGGITMSGQSTINFGSGLYYFTGQFAASGGDTANGSNVTFYAAGPNGSYNISGGANLSLSAPTSGAYNGILFWQAQGDTQAMTVSGGSTSTVEGVIYAPSAQLNLSGNTGTNFDTDIVTDSLNLSGSSSLHNYSALPGVSDPIKAIQMVE